jgi:single-strand DNA-binding protein
MKSVNLIILLGNVTKDAELKSLENGQAVCTFSIATNEEWTDKQGEKQKRTEFHNVVTWGKLADICGQFVRKGMPVHVVGSMKTRSWEAEGKKQYRTEVTAQDVTFVGSKKPDEAEVEPSDVQF